MILSVLINYLLAGDEGDRVELWGFWEREINVLSLKETDTLQYGREGRGEGSM